VRTVGGDGNGPVFGSLWDVAVDSRAWLYVIDRRPTAVLAVSPEGTVRQLGRPGGGPGEYRQPWRLAIGTGDTLSVLDIGTGRVLRFAADGAYAGESQLEEPPPAIDMLALPSGEYLLIGFEVSTGATMHRYRRTGVLAARTRIVRPPRPLGGFETSLVGGHVDLTPSGAILFSQLTPYALELWGTDGELLWRCEDPSSRLTNPADIVIERDGMRGLSWGRFVHTGSVFALSDSVYLNVVTDPVNDRRQFDLVDRSCTLLSRLVVDAPMLLTKRTPDRRILVGALNIDTPTVVVYRVSPTTR
jgi:hypothetical protein